MLHVEGQILNVADLKGDGLVATPWNLTGPSPGLCQNTGPEHRGEAILEDAPIDPPVFVDYLHAAPSDKQIRVPE